ncbi:hypothetical protein B0H10DRAFT_2201691 [Mycena sp. CBHHK59/15]|nr:hypothetical protein B0H10DRAFT_2201691 [Mycena sp. CBHHK59/15]
MSQPQRRALAPAPAARGHAAARSTQDKENDHQDTDVGQRAASKTQSSRGHHSNNNHDKDDEGHQPAFQEEDDEEDGSPIRAARVRRMSAKQMQLVEDSEAAESRKAEKAAKAAKKSKKQQLQASGEDDDEDMEPRQDDLFTSRTVQSRPAATKILAQRNSKVPPPPNFPSDAWRQTGPSQSRAREERGREERHDVRDHRDFESSSASDHDHRARPSPVVFRGRSPTPAARLARPPQARNERANEFQEIMGTYFLACSTPRRQFDVLAHAGLTVSYSKAINDLKSLSAEGLARLRRMVQEKACMIVWDNLNIAFKVGEQRHNSKDTFENGTTATLIVLYGVLRGELELELLEPRTNRRPARQSSLWHVRRIFLEHFPTLAAKFKADLGDVPIIRAIPLHQSEHLRTPAMKIDESSLDGTIDVIDTTVTRTLQLTAAGMRAHGVMFAGGDLLSLNLTDKAIAARREDTELLDAYGSYLKGMLGLFHVKLSGTRGTVNEHWGKPNSKFPGSLWTQNSFLSRKSISVGWKAKKLAPFRPTYELMLTLSLPAHILDGFRIHCGADSLDSWVESNLSWADIESVSEVVVEQLCSASTVEELRMLPEAERDPQLENTILCNHDMLLLLLFTTSIKSGDVGMVLNILAHWMVMFRGTGSMPKYADALFELINNLKRWPPALRVQCLIDGNSEAYLNNWLVNLSGKINGFKEIDLLQEHQNFWAKGIVPIEFTC